MSDRYKYASWEWEAIGDAWDFDEDPESGWHLVFPLGSVFRPSRKVSSIQELLSAWYSAE